MHNASLATLAHPIMGTFQTHNDIACGCNTTTGNVCFSHLTIGFSE